MFECKCVFDNRSLDQVDGGVSFDYRTYSDDYWEISMFKSTTTAAR